MAISTSFIDMRLWNTNHAVTSSIGTASDVLTYIVRTILVYILLSLASGVVINNFLFYIQRMLLLHCMLLLLVLPEMLTMKLLKLLLALLLLLMKVG